MKRAEYEVDAEESKKREGAAYLHASELRAQLTAAQQENERRKLALAVMCKNADASGSACRCCQQRWNLAADDLTGEAFRAKHAALASSPPGEKVKP